MCDREEFVIAVVLVTFLLVLLLGGVGFAIFGGGPAG
jgi:preprotein translocase subunit Sss1